MSMRVVAIAVVAWVTWSCGGDRVTQLQEIEPEGQVGQLLGKMAAQYDAGHAAVMVTLSQDGAPVIDAAVGIARSVSGKGVDYTEFAGAMKSTDENGRAVLKLSGSSVTGYYQARASNDGFQIGSWSSIPINAGYRVLVNLPIGDKARVTGSFALSEQTIVFNELNWASAQLQNRIAQYIVEQGYGYPTDLIAGSTLPLFDRLRKGDTHVFMEVWLPNLDEVWAESQAAGDAINVGPSLGSDWQSAFVIPAYLQEQYPDLDSVDDLKEDRFKSLFATEETGGKARLMSCVSTWGCAEINAAQIEGYGLSDHVQIVTPEDAEALDADLYRAYENGDPWLGFQWGTNDPALLLNLVPLEEPEYSDECWETNKACAYEAATILIAVHSSLPARAPDVVDMLRAWGLDIDRYKEVAAWQSENPEAGINDAALWWLGARSDHWSGWVTGNAAAAIKTALNANEIPDGWPEE